MAFQDKKENPAHSLSALHEFANRGQLEEVETYTSVLDDTLAVLSQGDGLIQLADIPTIVIPDLHARRPMLTAILGFCLHEGSHAEKPIFDLLQQGLINVVCVGDIVHSEERSDWVINNDGKYEESLDGLVVRLNNPKHYVFAYVPDSHVEHLFDPPRNVYIKSPTEEAFHQ